MVKNEDIKKVLLAINPLARRYFQNMIEKRTGIDPTNVNSLDLESDIHFLKHVLGVC